MASGMGMRGTAGRCYGFFQDLETCVVNLSMEKSNMSIDEIKETSKKCAMYRADYFECLHGDKRVARAKVLAKAQEASEGHGH